MNLVFEKLEEIRKRPALYIGKKSLNNLSFYITGYYARELEKKPKLGRLLPGFQEFIQEKFKERANIHWSTIIALVEPNDERAFDKFYEILDEFLKKYPESLE